MTTQKELELKIKKKIAHKFYSRLTDAAELEAITPELLNSNINDDSEKSDLSVAFCLAVSTYGLEILSGNNHALALQIEPETLNAVNEGKHWAEYSVAYVLATHEPSILAANDYFLGSKINKIALNAPINNVYFRGQSLAIRLAASSEGRTVLAANNYALALLITPETLALELTGSAATNRGASVFSILNDGSETGAAILNAIKYHRNNELMLTLFSAKISRLNKKSNLRLLSEDMLGSVLEYMDGRSYKSPRPQI